MTDSSIPDVPAFADALSPLERAKLGLQDELSVFEIGLVTYPEKDTYPDRERLTKFLLEAIKNGWLAAYGNPDGWTVEANSSGLYRKNPYPRCDGHEGSTVPDYSQFAAQCGLRSVRDSIQRTSLSSEQYKGDWCLVMRADYLAFLATPAAFGIPVPDQWKAPPDEPVPSAPILSQGEPDKPEQGAAATRQIALVEAEDVALATLRKELKREPDFEEFWNYITKRDDTGTIADHTNDRLMWTGKDGRNCETAKSTMRNRLTKAKSRNPKPIQDLTSRFP